MTTTIGVAIEITDKPEFVYKVEGDKGPGKYVYIDIHPGQLMWLNEVYADYRKAQQYLERIYKEKIRG